MDVFTYLGIHVCMTEISYVSLAVSELYTHTTLLVIRKHWYNAIPC